MAVSRAIVALKIHFKVQHSRKITDAEAFRMATTKGRSGALYAEGLFRDYREVQGGAPGLGRKR